MDSTSIIEPAPADPVAEAGSTSSTTPNATRDVGRALLCAALVAASVASPATALLVAPFVPLLVAVRLLRSRIGARRFLVGASVASLVAAAAVVASPLAIAEALLLVPVLGWVHARSARRDPIDAPLAMAWPEPRLTTGLTPTLVAWTLAMLVVAAAAAPAIGDLEPQVRETVRDAFGFYTRECADGGVLASNERYCEQMLDRRDELVEQAGSDAHELVAVVGAAFAFGSAVTAHLLVMWRARRRSDRVRPAWRLRDLELHWSFAYLAAAGLAGWMLASGDGTALLALRCASLVATVVGGLAILCQGIGLAAWALTRGRTPPRWYKVFLAIMVLVATPIAAGTLLVLGMIDMWLRPRRRAAARESSR